MTLNRAATVMDQGHYFTANNGTAGVATATAPTAFSDTAPFFTIQNLGTLGTAGPSIYLDWYRVYNTAAGTAGVDMKFKVELDKVVPTGGTLLTGVCTNSNDGAVSVAAIRIQGTGIAATGSQRVLIGQVQVIPAQTAVFTVGTEVNIKFGGVDGYGAPAQVAVAQQAVVSFRQLPPIVIAPGWALQVPFSVVGPQSAASSWAHEFGWVEF